MSAADFRRAIEARELDALEELLAPAIEFHSPVTHHPFIGRETVASLLRIVAEVFEDFTYTQELAGQNGVHELVFRARVGDRELEGIDLLRFEDGLIAEFTVMIRPLSALVRFAETMGPRVAAAGLAPTRG